MKINMSAITVLDERLDIWEEVRRNPIDEEAVHLCDLSDVVRKFINWTNVLPRVVPFYAVKANDSLNVIRVLDALGTGFDCASKHELKTVLGLGVSASRIIFAHPAKPSTHLEYAVENGVHTMTFDNVNELHKIKSIAPNAKLVVRISCDASLCLSPLADKFGCNPEVDAPELLRVAKKLELEIVGVSFHVGSGCFDFPSFAKAIGKAKKLFDVATSLGHNFTLLDLGGGFLGDKDNSLIECAKFINTALDTHFPGNDVRIIAEPGRYFVTTANTVMTRIHSKRQVFDDGVLSRNMYYINDGIYGTLSCVFNEKIIVQPTLSPTIGTNGPLIASTIWGPTCDILDRVVDTFMLPDLQIGEMLAFEERGSYSLSMATGFHGHPFAKTRYFMERGIINQFPVLEKLSNLSDDH